MFRMSTSVLRWPSWKLIAIAISLLFIGVSALLVRDALRIDPTSGGYSAPYDDFEGEPIDWSAQAQTERGFRGEGGIMLNASLNCTSGQIRLHVGPFSIDYRKLSERAIAVHKPHVSCIERGFEPQWDFPASDLTDSVDVETRG